MIKNKNSVRPRPTAPIKASELDGRGRVFSTLIVLGGTVVGVVVGAEEVVVAYPETGNTTVELRPPG
jgi:hypothetical protein